MKRLILFLFISTACLAQTSLTTVGVGSSLTIAAGGGTPTLGAQFSKNGIDRNRGGNTSGGNARIFALDANGQPGAVTSGSLVIMSGSWPNDGTVGPHSCTAPCEPVWSDNGTGNTWNRVFTIASCRDSNTPGIDHNIYYAMNFTPTSTSQTPTKITATHPQKVTNSYWNPSWWYNMATTSALDSSSCLTGQTPANNTAPNITGTAITIAAANELVYVDVHDNSNGGINTVSSTTVPANCTAIDTNDFQGHWSMYCLPSSGSFTPTFTVAQTTHDTFTIMAASFKSGSGGSAPSAGARILTSQQQSFSGAVTRTFIAGCPTTTKGVIVSDDVNDITSITDSNSNTWTGVASGGTLGNGSGLSIWRTLNITVSNPNTYTLTITTANGNVDLPVVYCTTATQLDTGVTAGSGSTQVNSSTVSNTGTFSATPTNGGTVSSLPLLTPGATGTLFIGTGAMGTGPWLDCSVLGCVDDYPYPVTITTCASATSAGECGGDADNFGNGDVAFHFWENSTAQVNFTHVGNPSQSITIMVQGFKP